MFSLLCQQFYLIFFFVQEQNRKLKFGNFGGYTVVIHPPKDDSNSTQVTKITLENGLNPRVTYLVLIENDHLGEWNPEKDCCLSLTTVPLRTSVTQMTIFNQKEKTFQRKGNALYPFHDVIQRRKRNDITQKFYTKVQNSAAP